MASLVLSPGIGVLNFGNVPVSSSALGNIITEVHGGINHIDEVTWSAVITGPDASQFSCSPFGCADTTVQAEPQLSAVRFSPTSPGAKTAFITITPDPGMTVSGPFDIELNGNGAAGGFLTLAPQTTNDFGQVKDGTTSAPLNVLASNNSGTNVIVTAIAFSGSAGAINATATSASGSGYAVNDTGTITGGGGSGGTYVVTAVDGLGGVLSFNILAPGLGYSTGSNLGTAVTTGGGDGAFTIDILSVLSGQFAAGPGQPALPFTLLANGASPPVVISVLFEPTITGFVLDPNAVVVTSNATNTPTSQAMQGTGIIIVPAFSLPLRPQAVLMAFAGMSGISVLRMDSTDLDCEEAASFSRVYDWAAPLQEKYLGRVIFRYEDESAVPFDLLCTVILTRAPISVSDALINVGGVNDGKIYNAFFDLQQTDDLIQIVISRMADDGPVVITEIFHEIDPRGEFIPT